MKIVQILNEYFGKDFSGCEDLLCVYDELFNLEVCEFLSIMADILTEHGYGKDKTVRMLWCDSEMGKAEFEVLEKISEDTYKRIDVFTLRMSSTLKELEDEFIKTKN